jgi:uncharacterized protein YbjT (DUF2867 family)
MVILITGASGFIGRHLQIALRAAGHTVMGLRRSASASGREHADFTRDLEPEVWVPRLAGVDVVINAVGILRETRKQSFDAIHTRAPQALFRACVTAKVPRVIQISALGADQGTSGYFRSKHAADVTLASLPLEWTIVQPSLVYGTGGTSAHLFSMLATLPITPLPSGGHQRVQPIHIDDLIAAIVALCVRTDMSRRTVPLVGPRPLTLKQMLQSLRESLGLGPAWSIAVPRWLMQTSARVAELSPGSLLDRETLAMLEAGNTADPAMTTSLIERAPREVTSFVPRELKALLRREAQLSWLLPLLRYSIAAVWIWTGIVSAGLYPREESLLLLERTGVPSALGPLMLYGAAALDFAFGLATLLLQRRRLLWLLQIALIALYSVIITIKLPEFWLHPYGPILKNLPMLAALYLLYILEDSRWNTSS